MTLKHLEIVSEVGACKWNEIGRALFNCSSGTVIDLVSHRRDSKDSEKLLIILEEWVNKDEHPQLEQLLRVCAKVNIDGEVERRLQIKDSIDDDIYQQALDFGSVPINRYRVMVVGQDGAGKSCLIESFLGRPFKAQNPSTDGIAIHVAVTAAEGKAGQHTWNEEKRDKAQHLNKFFAAGYVITKKHKVIILYSYAITFDLILMLGVKPDGGSFPCKATEIDACWCKS